MRYVLRFFVLLCVALPLVASAQAYVPVIDINMEVEFPNIMADNEDSIRNIIAGPQPGGVALEDCAVDVSPGDTIFGYEDGPWARAYAVSQQNGGELPDPGPGNAQPSEFFNEENNPPQEIVSTSLRCLLEQQIEFQKLQLSLQIHDLLRSYVSDAQQYLLTKQLAAHISAANTEYIKQGNQTCVTDQLGNKVCTHRSLTNPDQKEALNERAANVGNDVVDRIINNDDNPQGNYGSCTPFKLSIARQVLYSQRSKVEDPTTFDRQSTSCTADAATGGAGAAFKNQATMNDFYGGGGMKDNAITQHGTEYALWGAINDDSMSPLGSYSQINNIASRRITDEKTLEAQKIAQGNGLLPDSECSETPDDPRCVNHIDTTPGALTKEFAAKYAETGYDTIMNAHSVDEWGSPESQAQSTKIVQGGFTNYQDQALQETDNQVPYNSLVREFNDVINYGYWGTKEGTRNWAQATMLMIYDEMSQREIPQVDVPTGETGDQLLPGDPAPDPNDAGIVI